MRAWLLYTGGLIVLVVGSYLAAGGAFMLHDSFAGSMSGAWWWVYVLNGAAPFLAGVLVSAFLVRLLERLGEFHPTLSGHLRRTSSWYVFGVWILIVAGSNRGDSDFGLWSQMIIWPLASTTAALCTDLVWTWRRSVVSRTA